MSMLFKLSIIWTLVCWLSADIVQGHACPDGWNPSVSDMCVQISTTAKTWDHANFDCRGLGGGLLTLETVEKSYYIKGWLTALGRSTLWIGGRLVCDRWTWAGVYKDVITKYDWFHSEPNGKEGEFQDCLLLSPNLQWYDHTCGNSHHYICEKKAA